GDEAGESDPRRARPTRGAPGPEENEPEEAEEEPGSDEPRLGERPQLDAHRIPRVLMGPPLPEIPDEIVVGPDPIQRMGEKLPHCDPPDVVAARAEARGEMRRGLGGRLLVPREVTP